MIFIPAFAQVKDPSLTSDDSALAQLVPDHFEAGDATDLPPGQDIADSDPLDSISGIIATDPDVDMYRICVTDPSGFSADTSFLAAFDTQLFLFNAGGFLIDFDDDGGDGLQSFIGPFVGSPGIHLLAINSWPNFPVDDPITAWDGNGFSFGDYGIALTGSAGTINCGAVGGTMIPIDTTALLLAGAQMNAAWMIPVIVVAIGFAIVIARKY